MKKTFASLAAAAAIAAASAASANTVVFTGEFNAYSSPNAYELGSHQFSTSGGQTIINLYSIGFNGNYGDSYIYLFNDDGNLTSDDYVAQNDDYYGPDAFVDGGYDHYDSYLNLALAAGNYLLLVSNFGWGLGSTGVMNTFNNPSPTTGTQTFHNDYQVTLTGNDIVLNAPAPVPLPASLPLLGSAIIAAGALARRKRKTA